MKTQNILNTTLLVFLFICSLTTNVYCQTLWTGPMISFSKGDYVDWTLPQNQDSISPNICITRADRAGIFNIKLESEFDRENRTSPADTEWANGSIADGIQNLEFSSWFDSVLGSTEEEVGVKKVMHLISEDIYIDLVITEWTPGGGGSGTGFGGGFTYMRSTKPTTVSIEPIESNKAEISIFPNPGKNYLYINPVTVGMPYSILNSSGRVVQSGNLDSNAAVEIKALAQGLYIIHFDTDNDIRIVKRFLKI